MKVRNITYHLVHVGNISISPGQIAEIPKEYESSINEKELQKLDVKASASATKPSKETSEKTAEE